MVLESVNKMQAEGSQAYELVKDLLTNRKRLHNWNTNAEEASDWLYRDSLKKIMQPYSPPYNIGWKRSISSISWNSSK